jgi:hypothetical protein
MRTKPMPDYKSFYQSSITLTNGLLKTLETVFSCRTRSLQNLQDHYFPGAQIAITQPQLTTDILPVLSSYLSGPLLKYFLKRQKEIASVL